MKNNKYILSNHWYLGFLAIFGLPDYLNFLQSDPYNWHGMLWFLWLLDFLPVEDKKK